MPRLHAGLDVADRSTSICVVTEDGDTVLEAIAETTPEAIAAILKPFRRTLKSVGQEAGAQSAWLHRELLRLKFPMHCLDAFHAHSLLRTRLNKTDRNDARGLALLMAKGLFSPTHVKSEDAIRIRIVLGLRESILRKALDLDFAVRAAHKQLGSMTDKRKRRAKRLVSDEERAFEIAIRQAIAVSKSMTDHNRELTKVVNRLSANSSVCQRLMTIPGVGPITALTFVAAIDDPHRFKSSRGVAAYFGLTPRTHQSGNSGWMGGISRRGDSSVRKALFAAARSMIISSRSTSSLRRWGVRLASERGYKVAYVGVARKLAVLMHHLWITGQDFDASR